MERKRRFQTRAQYTEEKAKTSKFYKMDKMLNYLIAVVAVLIVVTLGWLISRDGEPSDQVQEQQQADKPSQDKDGQGEDGKEQSTDGQSKDDADQETDVEQEADVEQEVELSNTEVTTSTDPNVKEVHTNTSWPAYPTAQTGEHVSVFKKGHIDYEEKLKAFFSVLDIDQENSIVWSVKNNGNAQSAIAVVHSKDKEKIYRVSIEWFDNEGWKPIQYEVLNTLEGL